jgi:hypothetical protein
MVTARKLRAEFEALGPLPIYDEQRFGDVAGFEAIVDLARRRMAVRRRVVEQVRAREDACFYRHLGLEAPATERRRRSARAGAAKRQRRSAVDLRRQVLDLHRRGLVVAAIADALNVADRRVQQIIGNPANSHKIPHEQGDCEAQNGPVRQLAIFAI